MSTCSWSGPILIKISSSCSIVNGAKKIIILIASIASNDLFYMPFYFAFTHLTECLSSCTYYMVMDKIFTYVPKFISFTPHEFMICMSVSNLSHHFIQVQVNSLTFLQIGLSRAKAQSKIWSAGHGFSVARPRTPLGKNRSSAPVYLFENGRRREGY